MWFTIEDACYVVINIVAVLWRMVGYIADTASYNNVCFNFEHKLDKTCIHQLRRSKAFGAQEEFIKINAVSDFNLHYLQRGDSNHLAGSLNTGWLAYDVSNTWRILSSSRSWQKSWPESRWISTQLQSSASTISRSRSTLSTCKKQLNVRQRLR